MSNTTNVTNSVPASTPDAQIPPKVIPRGMLLAFVLVTGLFALWGFANDITNPMVAAFKESFLISHFQSSLVTFAFYGGYCVMAIPAALFLNKFNYKRSILVGLGLYVAGCILFIPAGFAVSFWVFLFAYFVMTCGLSFLETTANPYILSLGPQETATRRLNFAQAFNPLGAISGMLIAREFILKKLEGSTETALQYIGEANPYKSVLAKALEFDPATSKPDNFLIPIFEKTSSVLEKIKEIYVHIASLQTTPKSEIARQVLHDSVPEKFAAVQQTDLNIIVAPYVVLGIVVAAIFVFFLFVKLPGSSTGEGSSLHVGDTLKRLLGNGAYIQGVAAQAFYVGVQIMCWTFIYHYAGNELGMSKSDAQSWNIAAMVIFVASRFICTYLLKYISPGGLLAVLGTGGAALILATMFLSKTAGFDISLFNTGLAGSAPGTYFLPLGLVSLVGVSGCMSLMFPTIYGIALRGLGDDAKLGSAGLIVAIGGGAFFPPLQGWIIDQKGFFAGLDFLYNSSTRASFVVALVCFLVIIAYGLRTKLVHHAK